MYFWYSSIGGGFRPASDSRHQFTTMSWPSGLMLGHRNRIALSSISFVFGSAARESNSYASCGVCCEPAISDACSPPLMSTSGMPSRASWRASASVNASGRARRWLMRRRSSMRARFAAEEMSATVHGFPNEVFPTSINRTYCDDDARRRKYSIDWSYVKSCESAPTGNPNTVAGAGTACWATTCDGTASIDETRAKTYALLIEVITCSDKAWVRE